MWRSNRFWSYTNAFLGSFDFPAIYSQASDLFGYAICLLKNIFHKVVFRLFLPRPLIYRNHMHFIVPKTLLYRCFTRICCSYENILDLSLASIFISSRRVRQECTQSNLLGLDSRRLRNGCATTKSVRYYVVSEFEIFEAKKCFPDSGKGHIVY
jgi:hypothetical protein